MIKIDKIYTIEEIKNIIIPIIKKHKVNRVYLFGSYARGDADINSDIDLRIDSKNIRGMFALGALYSDLEKKLQKSLDLVTTESLIHEENKRYTAEFYKTIKNEEMLLYEE